VKKAACALLASTMSTRLVTPKLFIVGSDEPRRESVTNQSDKVSLMGSNTDIHSKTTMTAG
jgi:hypothetical protein